VSYLPNWKAYTNFKLGTQMEHLYNRPPMSKIKVAQAQARTCAPYGMTVILLAHKSKVYETLGSPEVVSKSRR